MYLKLITIGDTMMAADLILVHEQLRLATASYINMGKLYRKIKALPDTTITADDLMVELGEVKSTINVC